MPISYGPAGKEAEIFPKLKVYITYPKKKKKNYIPLCLELQFQSFHPSEDENIKPSSKLTCLFHLTCDQWDTYNQNRNSPSGTPTLFKKSYEHTKAMRTIIQQGIILMLKNKALKIM